MSDVVKPRNFMSLKLNDFTVFTRPDCCNIPVVFLFIKVNRKSLGVDMSAGTYLGNACHVPDNHNPNSLD